MYSVLVENVTMVSDIPTRGEAMAWENFYNLSCYGAKVEILEYQGEEDFDVYRPEDFDREPPTRRFRNSR